MRDAVAQISQKEHDQDYQVNEQYSAEEVWTWRKMVIEDSSKDSARAVAA